MALFVQEPPGLEQMSLPFALVVREQLKRYRWICCGKDVDNYYMVILGRMQQHKSCWSSRSWPLAVSFLPGSHCSSMRDLPWLP